MIASMNPSKSVVVHAALINEAPLHALAVNEEGLYRLLGFDDGRSPEAARQASWRFRRKFNIRTLPGGVYSIAEIKRAVNEKAAPR